MSKPSGASRPAAGTTNQRGPAKPATAQLPKAKQSTAAARASQAENQLSQAVNGKPGSKSAPQRTKAPAPPQNSQRPGTAKASVGGLGVETKTKSTGPRKIRLTVSRVDPWSVMKLSFLMSVGIGIAIVVAAIVLWLVLDATGVFDKIGSTLAEIAGSENPINVVEAFALSRVVSIATVIAIVDVILITALSTLVAFIYNLGSTLVGGFALTLTDE
ncbi:DUF3566 domain-containing protein [Saxibacter everestensis]|uniref:DUF3566 domain-containing protein n=1 Tax=Saxibacter everestensis TaxID=2909229 RepID=A0ABY8QRZ5_9MICO|nr:DUF3566 domain-containing protein [Brevibacteriaceae bacterium ZFBP1038]